MPFAIRLSGSLKSHYHKMILLYKLFFSSLLKFLLLHSLQHFSFRFFTVSLSSKLPTIFSPYGESFNNSLHQFNLALHPSSVSRLFNGPTPHSSLISIISPLKFSSSFIASFKT